MEATVSLLFAGMIFLSITTIQKGKENALDELFVLQKEHDLFKAWMKENKFSKEEMVEDIEFVFPRMEWELEINNEKILHGKKTPKATSSEFLYITKAGVKHIKLTVFR